MKESQRSRMGIQKQKRQKPKFANKLISVAVLESQNNKKHKKSKSKLRTLRIKK
jgi:hypothetical protein